MWVSVSVTTRRPRAGEVDGIHYHFVSDADFDRLVANDGLLEWARYGHARYGTPAGPVRDALAAGRKVLLEIDLQGARQIRESLPEARFVFVAPPNWEALVSRLSGRGTETPAQMEERLRAARVELEAQDEFDHVVVNDDVERAVEELVDLIGLCDEGAPPSGAFDQQAPTVSEPESLS